jgi:hypothetical protein
MTRPKDLVATFVLIRGSGDSGWYWHLVATELRERGHEGVAPDLPADDDAAELWTYAHAVVDAIGEPTGLVVVASRSERSRHRSSLELEWGRNRRAQT